jgi:hypothetical protein
MVEFTAYAYYALSGFIECAAIVDCFELLFREISTYQG